MGCGVAQYGTSTCVVAAGAAGEASTVAEGAAPAAPAGAEATVALAGAAPAAPTLASAAGAGRADLEPAAAQLSAAPSAAIASHRHDAIGQDEVSAVRLMGPLEIRADDQPPGKPPGVGRR